MESQNHTQTSNTQNTGDDQAWMGEPTHEQTDVIHLTNVGEDTQVETFNDFQKRLFASSTSGRLHDIPDFVGRWSDLPVKTVTPVTVQTWDLNLSDKNFRKLEGLGVYRCTIGLLMLANVDPVDAGIVMMSYSPPYVQNDVDKQLGKGWPFMMQLSGRIHKKMPLAELTKIEMDVPLIVPGTGIRDNNLGKVHVALIGMSSSATGPKIEPALKYRIHDIQVGGPSSIRMQSDRPLKENGFKMSRLLNIASKGASELAKVPFITSYANTAAWVTRTASDALKFVGFSKPPAVGASTPRYLQPFHSFAQTGGNGTEMRLGANHDQGTSVMPDGFTEEDEMDIKYILSRPVLWNSWQWKKGQTIGTKITSFPVSAGTFLYNTKWGDRTVTAHTYFSYLMRCFEFWRGSINITLDLGANKFHSGRIRLIFDPLAKDDSKLWSMREVLYNLIWDVKEGTQVTFNCPWPLEDQWAQYGDSIGHFGIYVETPLQCNVNDTVVIASSVSVGEDFQMYAPCSYWRQIVNGSGADPPKEEPVFEDNDSGAINVVVTNTDINPVPVQQVTPGLTQDVRVVNDTPIAMQGDVNVTNSPLTVRGSVSTNIVGSIDLPIKGTIPVTGDVTIADQPVAVMNPRDKPLWVGADNPVPASMYAFSLDDKPTRVRVNDGSALLVKNQAGQDLRKAKCEVCNNEGCGYCDNDNAYTYRMVRLANEIQPSIEPQMRYDGNHDGFFDIPELQRAPFIRAFEELGLYDEPVRMQGYETGSSDKPPDMVQTFANSTNPSAAHQQVGGDPISNLRQLIKRYGFNSRVSKGGPHCLIIEPHRLRAYNMPTSKVNMDWIDCFAPMYAYRRGGIALTIRGFEGVAQSLECAIAPRNPYFEDNALRTSGVAGLVEMTWDQFDNLDSYLKFPYAPNITGAIMVECPYYGRWARVPFDRWGFGTKASEQQYEPKIVLFVQSSSGNDLRIYRRAADDFNFGGLMGPPVTFSAE